MKFELKDAKMIALNDGEVSVELGTDVAQLISTGIMDADSGFFFQRQIEHIQAGTYDVVYRDLTFREHIPTNNEGGAGISSFTYRSYSKVGKAKVGSASASDLPRADAEGKEFTFKVESLISSYGYNIDEINAARYSGAPLDARRADSCRRSIEEKLNEVAWWGDTEAHLPGLFTNDDINETASSGEWTGLTAEEILTEVNDAFSRIDQNSYGKHRPDTMLLPRDRWNYIMTTRSAETAATDMTIARFLVANSPYLSSLDDIKPVNECSFFDGADEAENRVMVVYEKDPRNLEFVVPQEMQFFNIQERNLEFLIPARARVVGTIVRYPRAIEFVTGI